MPAFKARTRETSELGGSKLSDPPPKPIAKAYVVLDEEKALCLDTGCLIDIDWEALERDFTDCRFQNTDTLRVSKGSYFRERTEKPGHYRQLPRFGVLLTRNDEILAVKKARTYSWAGILSLDWGMTASDKHRQVPTLLQRFENVSTSERETFLQLREKNSDEDLIKALWEMAFISEAKSMNRGFTGQEERMRAKLESMLAWVRDNPLPKLEVFQSTPSPHTVDWEADTVKGSKKDTGELEDGLSTALREMEEEVGITPDQVSWDGRIIYEESKGSDGTGKYYNVFFVMELAEDAEPKVTDEGEIGEILYMKLENIRKKPDGTFESDFFRSYCQERMKTYFNVLTKQQQPVSEVYRKLLMDIADDYRRSG
eukprot:TRINITY_DN4831_c0_g1_i1.p1 TRINITY_DN4831_c0_g1~~TRINITY_DN4831_c0_g1_i1.p1  ORF type:complete len:370 (+),score=76.08 TRINITY_DN4831_c0_g1_i1:46-1155(+)